MSTLGFKEFSEYSCICVGVIATAHHKPIQPQLLRHVAGLLQVLGLLNLAAAAANHVEAALVAEGCLQAAQHDLN